MEVKMGPHLRVAGAEVNQEFFSSPWGLSRPASLRLLLPLLLFSCLCAM